MKNQVIKFQKKSEKYSIFIGENTINLLPNKIKTLCPKTKKIGVIFDKNLPSNYKPCSKSCMWTSWGCCKMMSLVWMATGTLGKQLQIHTHTGRLHT